MLSAHEVGTPHLTVPHADGSRNVELEISVSKIGGTRTTTGGLHRELKAVVDANPRRISREVAEDLSVDHPTARAGFMNDLRNLNGEL